MKLDKELYEEIKKFLRNLKIKKKILKKKLQNNFFFSLFLEINEI